MTVAADSKREPLSGSLSAEIVRDIATRLQAGETVSTITESLRLRPYTARAYCRRLRTALNIQSPAERMAVVRDRVVDLLSRNVSVRDICSSTGCSRKYVWRLSGEQGFARRKLDLSESEKAEIENRLRKYERPVDVARHLQVSPGTVRNVARKLNGLSHSDLSCACGKPHLHSGMCAVLPKVLHISECRLREGFRINVIAKEVGYSAYGLRRAISSLIEDLRVSGIGCKCGKPVAHNGACRGLLTGKRRAFQQDLISKIDPLLRSGYTRRQIAKQLGVGSDVIYRLSRPLLTAWAKEGAMCACGSPVDHKGVCGSRVIAGGKSNLRVQFSATSLQVEARDRTRIVRMARVGRPTATIAINTGIAERFIASILSDYAQIGIVFSHCTYGRSRDHRDDTGPADESVAKASKTARTIASSLDKKTWRCLYDMFKAGRSVRIMADRTGLTYASVNAQVQHWIARRKRPLPPCPCGRPAYHSGGCSNSNPYFPIKRVQRRVDELVLSGHSIPETAEQLRIDKGTATVYAQSAREQLLAKGTVCSCGRPLWHSGLCLNARAHPPRPIEPAALERIRQVLLTGVDERTAARDACTSLNQVARVRAQLSDADKLQRKVAVKRLALFRRGGAQVNDLMQAAIKAVPAWAEPSSRSDIVNELYLGLFEGRYEASQIRKVAVRLARKGLTKFGLASLDASYSADDTRTLGDLIEDTTTTHQIDEITFGDYVE